MKRLRKIVILTHVVGQKHPKLKHAGVFLFIAITLTIVGEHGLAKFSFAGFIVRLIHLGGELWADRSIGKGFFHE